MVDLRLAMQHTGGSAGSGRSDHEVDVEAGAREPRESVFNASAAVSGFACLSIQHNTNVQQEVRVQQSFSQGAASREPAPEGLAQ